MPPTVVIDFSPLDTPTRVRGIGRYLQTLALGLSRLSPEQTRDVHLVALLRAPWSGAPVVTEDFSEVLRFPWCPNPTQRDRYRWAYARRMALWSVARKLSARVVHLGDPNATPLAMALSGCRRVVTCHDLIPLAFPSVYFTARDGFGAAGKHILRRRYRSADHVVAISDATRTELVSRVGLAPERISRVYNGIDLERWSPQDPGDDAARVEHHALRPKHYLLYVGDTDWRKNPTGMVRGLAAACRQGADVDLAFAGKLEPHKVDAIRALGAREGVAHRLRVLGYVSDSDLLALYRNSLAHLFVSRAEGFGYTVVEAMASGCPVITTNCGSLAEVAGSAALLVDPDDPADIGHAIAQLHSNPAQREELVRLGVAWSKRFSCELQASAMVDVFRSLVG